MNLFDTYIAAKGFVESVKIGGEVGQFKQEDVDDFKNILNELYERMLITTTNSKSYELSNEIAKARTAFATKANAYSLAELRGFIDKALVLLGTLDNEQDKLLLQNTMTQASEVAENMESTAMQINQAAVDLKGIMDPLLSVTKSVYDLSGVWNFNFGGYSEDLSSDDTVVLPGTLDENKKGTLNSFKDPRRLSRYYVYTGPATYEKEVFVPHSWDEKQISLYMERSRETRVWVNAEEVIAPDTSNLMATAQVYDLTSAIKFGEKNVISIVVDNSYPTTPRDSITTSSMATEETQTNWNGILGKFELNISNKVNIDDLRIYPNSDLKSVTVEVDVKNTSDKAYTGTVTVGVDEFAPATAEVEIGTDEVKTITVPHYSMDGSKLWSEFEQNLYTMTATLDNGNELSDTFGMRHFSIDSQTKQLTNNGNKVFLRNESNTAVFPLTAYAPMDEAGWEKLFSTYQSFGLNSVRFHSWTPPKAAFDVADRLGMFLQPELSSWNPNNMMASQQERDYYSKEAKAIMKEYANHPSFVMLAFGNELHFTNGGYEFADKLIGELKDIDNTRLYSFASNGTYGWTAPTLNSDFFTGQVYFNEPLRGIFAGMSGFINQSRPATTVNYNKGVKSVTDLGKAVFSFEVGQFQVFPDVLKELDGYTGVLEPRNLHLVVDKLEETNTTDEETEKFINASGMLSRLAYRMEIEAALRTENLSGISLLGIQDFSGQSTALVGMMNALGDAKPYDFAKPEQFSKFFSPEVILLETEKFVWKNDENFKGKILMANYGAADMTGTVSYKLVDKNNQVVVQGDMDSTTFTQGKLISAGEISIDLTSIKEASQLKLDISLGNVINSYDIWVYPANNRPDDGEVYVTEFLDKEALIVLEDGGSVLISPNANNAALPNSITGTFTTAFWSSQFVSESQPGSMGLLMNPEHPVFNDFPTEYHTNFQWWPMAKLGRPMVLENLKNEDGDNIQPLVQVIDSFSTIRTMGLLYEAKVGNGKLMVSSMGLEQLQKQYPEAEALKKSILNYMNSDEFNPEFIVDVDKIQSSILGKEESRVNIAKKSNGGEIFLGANTVTFQKGYDRYPQDRILELNDGTIDTNTPSRSWTDYNDEQVYPNDAIVGVSFSKERMIESVEFPFFEDGGTKAPEVITLQYWNGSDFVDIEDQSKKTGFAKGNNEITFSPVKTTKIQAVMKHIPGMGVALSEFIVYEHVISATSLSILTEGNKTEIQTNETLQLNIAYEPEDANDTSVRWSVRDEAGINSDIAKVSSDGILKPSAEGIVIVKATLKSNSNITAEKKIIIKKPGVTPEPTPKPEPTPTVKPSPKPTPTPSPKPTATPSPKPSEKSVSTTVMATTDSGTGTAIAVIEESALNTLTDKVKEAEASGGSAVVEIKVESQTGITTVVLEIPREAFNKLAKETDAAMKIDGALGTVTFSAEAVEKISSTASDGNITVSIKRVAKASLTTENQEVVGDRPVYEISVMAGNSPISNLGDGYAEISIPYTPQLGEKENAIIVNYINHAGKLKTIRVKYVAATGMVNFKTNQLTQFVVGYNEVSFKDVTANAWYNEAVSFMAAREIVNGVGGNRFAPASNITRADFLIMVMNAYGIELDATVTDNFTDAGNKYYTPYLATAKHLGIVTGVSENKYAPEATISRQDMFVILNRVLSNLGERPTGTDGKTIGNFNDGADIASYAYNTMKLFVETGIISGDGKKLNPKRNATRAEAAQILYNLLSK
ncbi:S-layer homology domain-containing protein [Paenibacillus yanchengensis]|uniref:S-layer homology domain-containing protein n=1 Tax=Paenibacillus yanchengensis TaxID=2035833 RepID=A0ABW4YFA1_9BACL